MHRNRLNLRFDFSALPKAKIKKTKKLALASIFAALGVVIMYIGAIFEVLDISMATIASMLCVVMVIELGGAYPWLVFAVTAALSFLILPQKFAALIYLLIAGYYPMLKCIYERRRSRIIEWFLKLLTFNAAMALTVLLAALVLSIPGMGKGYIISLFALGNFTFIIYDLALTMLINLYFIKYRKLFRIDKIFK